VRFWAEHIHSRAATDGGQGRDLHRPVAGWRRIAHEWLSDVIIYRVESAVSYVGNSIFSADTEDVFVRAP